VSDYLTLIIWDSDEELPKTDNFVALWQSYIISTPNREISVPQLVESEASQYRSEYLALVYELGETSINNQKVVEHLDIGNEFSYWWMTLLNEKCNYVKSTQIDNIIKFFAFRKWFEKQDVNHVILVSENNELADVLKLFIAAKGINFERNRPSSSCDKDFSFSKFFYGIVPDVFKATAFLIRYLILKWSLKGAGLEKWSKSKSKLTFVSYLFNFNLKVACDGRYHSEYWSELPDLLEKEDVDSNWLHIYVENKMLPSAVSAKKIIEKFNQTYNERQTHVTLDSFLSFRVALKALKAYFRISSLYVVLSSELRVKYADLWPMIEQDLSKSLVSAIAMSNLLQYFLFEEAMSRLNIQRGGYYLQENQGWEFGFVKAWQNANHANNLIGIPHSTVRYWDLRYFFDSRVYDNNRKHLMPRPNFVGVNGDVAKCMYLDGGYAHDELIEVEALRYLYLNNIVQFRDQTIDDKSIVLVLGDCLKQNTDIQMKMLQDAAPYVETKVQYLVKPHPNYPIYAEEYPRIDLVVTDDPIHMLIDQCSVAYTSSGTSAAVDLYCAGKQVIVVRDQKTLNLSPLKDNENVVFVDSSSELVCVLDNIKHIKEACIDDKYFYTSKDLPRWKKLVSNQSRDEIYEKNNRD